MGSTISYNRMRAASARRLALKADNPDDRWRLLRISHQYDAITELEAATPLIRRGAGQQRL